MRLTDWLILLSLGKYRTPLYYKKNDSYSSVVSSILSLGIILLILTMTVITFKSIFSYEQHVIDQKEVKVQRYMRYDPANFSSNYEIDRDCLETGGRQCEIVTVRDMLKLIFDHENLSFMIQDRRTVDSCNDKFNVTINFMLFTI